MGSESTRSRRRYGDELKAQVLAECAVPGASVAKVAMAHGINANVVHRWRQLGRHEHAEQSVVTSEFVPVSLAAPPAATVATTAAGDIRIQLRRGTIAMTITWPVAASGDFAAWMRELLQ